MRRLAFLSIVLLLSSCSWANHFLGRSAGKKTTAQVFTNGKVLQEPWVLYGRKFEEIQKTYEDGTTTPTGTYRKVIDEQAVVARLVILAEDGKEFLCECPIELVSFCMELKRGEQVKVNGEAVRMDDAVLQVRYIKRK